MLSPRKASHRIVDILGFGILGKNPIDVLSLETFPNWFPS